MTNRGDGGALRDAHRDGSKRAGGLSEHQAAGTVSEERADPMNQVGADPLSAEEREEGRRFHIVETASHIEEERGDFLAEAVAGFNVVL